MAAGKQRVEILLCATVKNPLLQTSHLHQPRLGMDRTSHVQTPSIGNELLRNARTDSSAWRIQKTPAIT